MLDINTIRNNKQIILDDLKKRGNKELIKTIDKIVELDKQHIVFKKELDDLKHKRNTSSKQISELIKQKKKTEAEKLKNELKNLSKIIAQKDKEKLEQSQELRQLMLLLPNILHKSVPLGKDDSENLEIRNWGDKKKYDFPVLNHIELGEYHDLFDIERAAKVSGARFYYLKNDAVKLEFALIQFALDFLKKKGFILTTTPMLIKEEILEGAGFLPAGADDVYKIEGENKYLVGTSEQALCGYYANETMIAKDLPIKMCGYSSCFRTEAGSHGKDTKGIFRVHQFEKIEMFIFCHPEKSWEEHEKLISVVEE
ncbi:MAG: serine--tRNA ligase, partial [Candidatus Aenigmarchaeota archaeon]|nr:serine--tRNA ligase [Candidatus Aenigmarchaeota archaeon]